jgi:hypothetical protein
MLNRPFYRYPLTLTLAIYRVPRVYFYPLGISCRYPGNILPLMGILSPVSQSLSLLVSAIPYFWSSIIKSINLSLLIRPF